MADRGMLRERIAYTIKHVVDGSMFESNVWSRRKNQWCFDLADVVIVEVAEALLLEIKEAVTALRAESDPR